MINPKETPGKKGEVDVIKVISRKFPVVKVKLKKPVEAKVERIGKHENRENPVEAKVERIGKHEN